ncbi:MAG TPA: hypothetical protein VF611_12765 [Pyrinomonadaceae bacterium]|jgi:septal ring factor EnvC (AmiA/AmiB activator)
MRKTPVLIPIALLCLVATFAGCDTHKDERASLLKKITDIETESTRLNAQMAAVSKDVEALPAEIRQYADRLQQHEQRRTKLQDDLAEFLLNHKMAAVALMATAGGAATIINNNIDEDSKAALRLVGVIGALYCVVNSDECADVAARVLYFGSQIEAEEKGIAEVTSKLSSKRSLLQTRQKERASLGGAIESRTNERDALRRKHDSLLCRYCL